jgi:hypothetical protein
MSKFYGSIEGSAKTTATRCGTKNSGIESHTRGWDQGVRVSGWDDAIGRSTCECVERFDIYLTGGSSGKSNDKYIGSLEDGKWIPAKIEGAE